jgi:spermidine/putrescine transport system permease protein
MNILKKAYVGIIIFIIYAPIALLMVFSFNNSKAKQWKGFTLKWYIDLFNDSNIQTSFYYTILVALVASLLATVIGTLAAIGIEKMRSLSKTIVMNLTYIPVLSPDIVIGISLMLLFSTIKIPLGTTTLILAHTTFCIPYVILSVMPKLKQLNYNIYEAALDLGATPFYAFRKVILPEIMPGIISGAFIAFTLSIDDFVVKDLTPDEIKLLQKGGGFNIPEGAEVVAAGWVAGKNGKVNICLKGITDIDGFIGFQDDIINGVKKLYSNDRKSISMNNER